MASCTDFRALLGTELIISDGGLGTMLQEAGLAPGEPPTLMSITQPEEVLKVHTTYAKAGAQILSANTFSANALMLEKTPYSVEEVVSAAVALARQARDEHAEHAFVALDIGPLGKFLEPLGDLSLERASELFTEQVVAGQAAGAELIFIETMMDLSELSLAIKAVKQASSLPLVATVTVDKNGRMLDGSTLERFCLLAEESGVDALGVNCSVGPEELIDPFLDLRTKTALPLALSPNAGLPEMVEGSLRYPLDPQRFASLLEPLVQQGAVDVLGGCCGTTPRHIQALVEMRAQCGK